MAVRQGKLRQPGLPQSSFLQLLLAEGHAVGALVNSGVHFVGTHQDAVQGAVILVATMVGALLDSTLDALVCMTVHRKASFEIGFCSSMDSRVESIQESFSKLAKMTLLWYCVL